MSSQGKGGKVEKQKGSVNNSRVPMRSPNNTGASRNSPAGGGGAGAKTARQRQTSIQESSKSNTEAVKNGPAQGQDTKKARPLPNPPDKTKTDRKKELNRINNKPPETDDTKQKKDLTEKQFKEDMSTDLQTLAEELSITGSSPQEIIEAACRKAKELEELKKDVFLAKNVNDKDHDAEKTKAKIQDLHSNGRELMAIKTAVMNRNKSENSKPTLSADEVIEKIHILHGIEQECLGLKEIAFNKELLKLASFDKLAEKERTVENANKIAAELTSLCKKMKTDQKKIFEEVLGKSEQPSMEEVLKAVQSLKKTADETKTEIQQQKTTLEKMEKEITELKGQLKDAGNKHQALLKRNQELTDEINDVRSQKEKALTRLSEVAGAKLTESNPYITDLSDPNRPEKIGEQFSELYDNLWTDVFEQLSGTCKLSERDSIQTLLQILEDSYGYCKDISSKRYSNTLAELTLWKFVEPNETPSQVHEPKKEMKNTQKKKKGADTKETTVNITLDELQKLQTLLGSPSSSSPADSKAVDSILAKIGLNVTNLSNIKKMLKSSLEGTSVIVQESFWKQRSEDPNGQKEVLKCTKPFLMKCVHICWLMVGQDPPVYLRFSDKCKDKFNKDIYREYTTNGEVLDFVVWPAIFLHENGPLLKKGVAQPISKK